MFPSKLAMLGAAGNLGGIEFVGSKQASNAGTADLASTLSSGLTGGIDTSVVKDDIVLVVQSLSGVLSADVAMSMVSSGYTLVSELYADGGSVASANISVHYKIMGASPDASVVTPGSLANNTTLPDSHIVMVFRGVDTGTPMDVARTTATGINTNDLNPAAITPVTSGAVILVMGGGGHANGSITYNTSGDPFDYVRQLSHDATYDVSAIAAWRKWSGGADNPAVITASANSGERAWGAVTMALRPA